MRGILAGGSRDGLVIDDCPSETESINMPNRPYTGVMENYAFDGEHSDDAGSYWLFSHTGKVIQPWSRAGSGTPTELWSEFQNRYALHDIPLVDGRIKVAADQSERFDAAIAADQDEATAQLQASVTGTTDGPHEYDLTGWATFSVDVVEKDPA